MILPMAFTGVKCSFHERIMTTADDLLYSLYLPQTLTTRTQHLCPHHWNFSKTQHSSWLTLGTHAYLLNELNEWSLPAVNLSPRWFSLEYHIYV